MYCPCHKNVNKWNKLSGVDELLDKNDICIGRKCPFKCVSGLKTHITTSGKNSNIHLAMSHYINAVYSKKILIVFRPT